MMPLCDILSVIEAESNPAMHFDRTMVEVPFAVFDMAFSLFLVAMILFIKAWRATNDI